MKIFHIIGKIFRAYTDTDKAISFACLSLMLLMVLKMIIFPYGVFNFGAIDTYTEGLVGENGFQNLNPLFVDYNDLDREASRLIFSGLVKYDTGTKAIVSDMADLTIDDTKTKYSFVMKDGLKWQDGEPVTVDDVYYTFVTVAQDPAFPNEVLKANFEGVKIEKADEKTIRFTLSKPNVFFITSLTTGLLPKHILEKVSVEDLLQDKFNKKPIGSGPYEVTDPIASFKDGRTQVNLTINPNYYGVAPKLTDFRFISFPTMDDLMTDLNSINGIVKVSGEYAKNIKATGDFVMFPYELPQYMAVFINMDSEKLQDDLARVALQKAVDKTELLAQMDDKLPVDTPLLELGDSKQWIYQPSIEHANGAIFEAGYKYEKGSNDQFRKDSKGNYIELSLIAREFTKGSVLEKETTLVTSYLKKQWESIGVKINLEILPVSNLNERIMDRKYDLLFIGQTLGYNLDTYSYWHSTQAGTGGLNLSNYKSFYVDNLIEEVRRIFSNDERTAKLKLIADRLAQDVPAIFLYKPTYYYASDGRVDGIDMRGVSFPGDRFSKISEWAFAKF